MAHIFEGEHGGRLRLAILAVLVLLGLFLAAKTIAEVWELRYIGSGVIPSNVITVSGEGEAVAVPDTAEFTFSVVERKASVAAAQEAAAEKINAIIPYLKEAGVEEKDIKTAGYNVYPQYEWQQGLCTPGGICPPGRQVLLGYEVRQTVTVVVRATEQAGELLSGVGERGAVEVSGLSFSVDKDEDLRNQARAEAIAKAKAEADALADQLGVRLVRIVSFNEFNGGYPPISYGYGRGGDMVQEGKAFPQLPPGENKILSNVTITYEIR